AARRQGARGDLDLLAQIPGERRPGGVGPLLGPLRVPLLLAVPLALLDDVEDRELPLLQVRLLLLRLLLRRVLLQPQLGGLGDQTGGKLIEIDGGAAAKPDPGVACQEERIGLLLGGAGELPDGAGPQVLQIEVALSRVDLPGAVLADVAARHVDLAAL